MDQQHTSQELVTSPGERYMARKAIFKFLGAEFRIFDAQENLCFFVKQKAFKLKEAITVYRDEKKTMPVMEIKARSIMDISATYDVTDVATGEKVGAMQRQGLKSIIRDEWHILDVNDQKVGEVIEDSMALALVRRFLSNLIPQSFTVTFNGQHAATFNQNFNPFVAKYDIDLSKAASVGLDKRMAFAAVVLLLAIEGKQR